MKKCRIFKAFNFRRYARHTALGSMALCAAYSIAPQTQAQTVFMVQLGTFESEERAKAHWTKLSSNFPELFDDLSYTPNEIVSRPDNFVSFRTQAGPIPTRGEAETLCDALGNNGHECYVMETAMFFSDDAEVAAMAQASTAPTPPPQISAPEPTAIPVVRQAVPLTARAPALDMRVRTQPVAAQVQPIIQALPPEEISAIPPAPLTSQTDAYSPTAPVPQAVAAATPLSVPDAPVVAATGQARGKIAVAEAIPVPLSQPKQNPYLERGNRLMDAHPSSSARVSSFWADISYFKNEADAVRYVQVLKSRDSQLPSKLRIRITRPYGNLRGTQKLSLRMGPFMTTRPVRRLCSLTRQDNLRCRAIKDMGGSVKNQNRLANRTAASRGMARSRYEDYRSTPRKAVNTRTPASQGGTYFVQLGSFLSPRAAEDKWSELQARHRGVLRSTSKDIKSPDRGSSRSRLFRLRAGPFNNYGSANSLCDSLKRQGTLCLIVKR